MCCIYICICVHNYINNKYCNCLVSHSTIRNRGFCNPMYCTNSNHVRVWWEIHLVVKSHDNAKWSGDTTFSTFCSLLVWTLPSPQATCFCTYTHKKNDAVLTWRLTPKLWPSKNGDNESWGFEHILYKHELLWGILRYPVFRSTRITQ